MPITKAARNHITRDSQIPARRPPWVAAIASVALSAGLLVVGTTPAAAALERYPCGRMNISTGEYEDWCMHYYIDYPPLKFEKPPILILKTVSPLDRVQFAAVKSSLDRVIEVHSLKVVVGPRPNPWNDVAIAALTQAARDLESVELKTDDAAGRTAVDASQQLINAISIAQSALATRDSTLGSHA